MQEIIAVTNIMVAHRTTAFFLLKLAFLGAERATNMFKTPFESTVIKRMKHLLRVGEEFI